MTATPTMQPPARKLRISVIVVIEEARGNDLAGLSPVSCAKGAEGVLEGFERLLGQDGLCPGTGLDIIDVGEPIEDLEDVFLGHGDPPDGKRC